MSTPAAPDPDNDFEVHEDDPGLDIAVLRRRRELLFTVLALTLILLTTYITATKSLIKPPPGSAELATTARMAIQDAMKGVVLAMGASEDLTIRQVTESLYTVSGQFSAIDPQGKSTYFTFTCSVQQGQNGHWRPARLVLNPLF
jgi:hypothetical protein